MGKPQEDPIDDTLHFRIAGDERYQTRCQTLCGVIHWTYYTRAPTANSRARVTCEECRWRLVEWFAFHKKPPTIRRWREWENGSAATGESGRGSMQKYERIIATDAELERQREARVAAADADLIRQAEKVGGAS